MFICYIYRNPKFVDMPRALYLMIFLLFSLNSCIEKYGCTDGDAENYNIKANSNDGSCYYISEGYIYWESYTEAYFINNNITSISIYFDGELIIENTAISQYSSSESASCNYPSGWIQFEQIISNDYDVHVEVFNQNNTRVISNVAHLYPGCNSVQILHN